MWNATERGGLFFKVSCCTTEKGKKFPPVDSSGKLYLDIVVRGERIPSFHYHFLVQMDVNNFSIEYVVITIFASCIFTANPLTCA